MIYKCTNCKQYVESPLYKKVNLEGYYGVGDLFSTNTRTNVAFCPICGEASLEELNNIICDYCGEMIDGVESICTYQGETLCFDCFNRLKE